MIDILIFILCVFSVKLVSVFIVKKFTYIICLFEVITSCVVFQTIVYFELGYLDPLFLIAFFTTFFIGIGINLFFEFFSEKVLKVKRAHAKRP